jgi:hypothetical protein
MYIEALNAIIAERNAKIPTEGKETADRWMHNELFGKTHEQIVEKWGSK